MRRILIAIAVAALMAGFSTRPSEAQSLPQLNLGLTSFLDGAPPAGPGFYYQQYLQYYGADSFKDSNGDDLPVPSQPSLSAWVSLNQFLYQSNQAILLGGKWGMDLIVPLVCTDLDPGSLPISDNGAGLGDILVGPYLQWDPIMSNGRPVFVQRVEFQLICPTGKYSENDLINPGSGFFSFNPYWAATVFPAEKCELSLRVHYLWNAENNDPNDTLFPGANDTQAGQAIHLNFAASYEVLPKRLRLGVNGYYLKQISDSQIDGNGVSNSEEQVLGIGPGALYSFSQNDHLFCNLYFETLTENRPEGIKALVRWVHHF